MTTEPFADRPIMPEYGLLPATAGRGLLPWGWAVERLARAHTYWLGTSREDGRPHLMPIWAIWTEDGLAFSTALTSRKARNLSQNPACTVAILEGEESVILEGRSRPVPAGPHQARILKTYREKYGEGFPEDSAVYEVKPRVAFAFIDRADEFVGASTRWRFPP